MLLILFGLLLIVFSIPSVQTRVAQKITNRINDTYDTDITIDKVGLKWNGDVIAKDILLRDHKQDTMIYVKSLATSVFSFKNAIDGNMNLGDVTLDDANLFLKKHKGDSKLNISVFSSKFATGKPRTKDFILSSDNIQINRGHLYYIDHNIEHPEVINYKNLNANLDNFHLKNETLQTQIESLSFDAARGYQLSSLSGTFHYDPSLITLSDFAATTNYSSLEGSIKLDTSDEAMNDFTNLVAIEAAFAKAEISTNDIIPFYNKIAPNIPLHLTGTITGVLNDFRVPDLSLKGIDRSTIKGDVQFKNIVKGQDFEINGRFSNLSTSYFDFKKLLPEVVSSLPKEITKLGTMTYRGSAAISSDVITVDGSVHTQLGIVRSAVVLSNFQNTKEAKYEGNIEVDNFNLGSFLNTKKMGVVSLNVDLDGKGLSEKSLKTQLSGSVVKLYYNGYQYKDITVFGNLNAPIFDGEIIFEDSNIKGTLNGFINVSQSVNNYDLEAQIDYANLSALNFVKDTTAILKGNVVMDMKGSNIEDISGRIAFEDTSYENENNTYFFKNFDVTSVFDEDRVRTININSTDIVDGEISGVFKFREIVPLFKNAIGSLYTNYKPEIITEDQFVNFEFTIFNKIVEIFVPEIKFEPKTFIKGSVVSNDSEFKLTFKSPQIDAFGYMAQTIEVRVDNKNPLFNTYVAADSINAGFYAVSDFNLINVTLKDTLFMRSEFMGGSRNDDSYDLSLYHTINEEGKSVLGFKKSEIVFKEIPWYLNENDDKKNNIVFDNNLRDIDIQNISLSHKDEYINIGGFLRDSTSKDVTARFNNVDLAKVTPDIETLKLGGRINGSLEVLQKNKDYFPVSSILIDNFEINEKILGDLDLGVKANASLTNYQIESQLVNDNIKSLTAKGSINASSKTPFIDLDVVLQDFDVSPFNAMGREVIDRIRGFASGTAKIVGDYHNPDINGELVLENGGLHIPYLNVDYDFIGLTDVKLDKQEFKLNDIQLQDVAHLTRGTLNGNIRHTSFGDWELDLNIGSDRLLVLDTEEDLESLYYGTAYLEGEAFIKGATDELVIDVFGETASGTVFKIPIDDSESLGDSSYIKFLSPEEKQAKINGEQIITEAIKGLSVNFDLDIDPDAEVEVVVDKESGSTLIGRGVGTLLIELDTNGKFVMTGDFIATQGVYNFRYGGFVVKDFIVQQDGNIRWDGDPTKALLDVSAVYRTQANPSTLLETSTVNRKIPVNVIINVTGQLLKPNIEFEIEFPGSGSTVTSELEFLLQDRNTRELNAISLVSQGAFLSTARVNTAAAAVNNLLETTSSILSGILFNDDDSIFDVGVDLVQAERDPTADVQSAGRVGFTLSTQISKRIIINGKVGVPTGGVSESVIVGDVEVDFLLNEDGTLRAKVFNRQTDIQFIGETEGYTQGVGLSYAVDFNTFKELLNKIFKGKVKEVVQQAKGEYDVPKIGPDGVQFNKKK